MKIVQINETCGTGSTGRLMHELVSELDSEHECLVAFSTGKTSYANSYQIGSSFDHKLHALLSRITGLQGYFSHIATYRLIKRLKEFKPDLVHLHNLHGNYINLRMLLSYLAENDTAVVLTLHDSWFYTGKCTYYVPAACEKWTEHCGKCPLLHMDNVNPTFFFDRTCKCLQDKEKWFRRIPRLAVVGVSQWVTSEASRSILKSADLSQVYNWIDQEVFHPRTSNLRSQLGLEGKFVVVMVAAAISEKKGYRELVEISRRMPENWAVVAIGRENSELPDNIIHIQHTDNAVQLAEYYSMADVCLNTTQYETFGMVTAEAMSCGTPVIVYNNTASPELLGEQCGYVVNQEYGMEAVFDALNTVQKNGKQFYTSHCIETAKRRFAKRIGVEGYLSVYEKLMEKRES